MKEHFIIPMNFMETGYVLNGAVAIRNAVEAAVMALIGFFLCKMLPLPDGLDAITYYILIIGPFFMLGLSGVQGDPLSVFIMDFFKWRQRRKPCFYNTHSEAYTQEAADLLMDAPQLRDMLADALDAMRKKMASEEIDYVEGKTFRFAADPEQEALKQAQSEIRTKQAEEIAKFLAERQEQETPQEETKAEPFVPPEKAKTVDAQQIADNIVLDELDWEEEY